MYRWLYQYRALCTGGYVNIGPYLPVPVTIRSKNCLHSGACGKGVSYVLVPVLVPADSGYHQVPVVGLCLKLPLGTCGTGFYLTEGDFDILN